MGIGVYFLLSAIEIFLSATFLIFIGSSPQEAIFLIYPQPAWLWLGQCFWLRLRFSFWQCGL